MSDSPPPIVLSGPYRLVRRLGSGGMGSVYLAERNDGEIEQKAAVKLLHADAHRAAWRVRFLRERQLLASLNHPSIVHVLDAGHTEEGQPYLAMEYVDGVPIDVYAASMGIRASLRLFLQVCDGVSHAHGHLIIHRDLKPSNILVDDSGNPKLLDFGIAKIIDDSGATITQTVEQIFTLDYASPEQLRGTSQTTATDIYSLGAVLYKMLTGHPPREDSPYDFEAIAAPSRLNPDIPTDLDYILMKALRAEPEERYGSVESFAADLRAFLESRPVQARAENRWYRVRRFVRRYWFLVAALAVVLVGLGIALFVTQRERLIAEKRFAEVRGLAAELLDVENEIRNTPGTLSARKFIVESVVQSLDQLSQQVRNDLGLRMELASAYRRVAAVQAQRTRSSFGLDKEALASLEKAEALLKEARASDPHDHAIASRWFAVEGEIANRLYDMGEEKRSVERAKATADQLTTFLDHEPASAADEDVTAAVYSVAGRILLNAGKTVESLRYSAAESRIAIARAGRAPTAENIVSAAGSLRLHGTAQRYAGELEGALESFRKAEALLAGDPDNPSIRRERHEVAYCRGLTEGEALGLSLQRFEDGAASLKEAGRVIQTFIDQDPSDAQARVNLGQTDLKLGQILLHLGDPSAALKVLEEGLRGLSGAPGTNRYVREYRPKLMLESSIALANLGKLEESRRRYEEAVADIRRTERNWPPKDFGPTDLAEADSRARAERVAAEGRHKDAAAIYQEAVRAIRASGHAHEQEDLDDAFRISVKLERISSLLQKAGEAEQAGIYQRERLSLWRQWQARLPENKLVRSILSK